MRVQAPPSCRTQGRVQRCFALLTMAAERPKPWESEMYGPASDDFEERGYHAAARGEALETNPYSQRDEWFAHVSWRAGWHSWARNYGFKPR